ncbi:hypothetical protein [Lolliginicoccus suaedae]|uniref:hypothetical protein n=1 Tax=Lolliginicoccus suaedae TaxID=2605429 RepID=UPI0011F099C6|nr:hypothetical protein [Lolliginicoccus suaedae]
MRSTALTISVTNLTAEPLVIDSPGSLAQASRHRPAPAPGMVPPRATVAIRVPASSAHGLTLHVGGDRDRPIFLYLGAPGEHSVVEAWCPPTYSAGVSETGMGGYSLTIAPALRAARPVAALAS